MRWNDIREGLPEAVREGCRVVATGDDWDADRSEVDRFEEIDASPPFDDPPRVAIIGAGIAGAICARTLLDHGLTVDVFDKGRRPGGRMATRRVSFDDRHVHFDHGAQYFTARDRRFRQYVDSWREQGLVERWDARFAVIHGGEVTVKEGETERFVGTPTMNVIVRHLTEDVSPRFSTRVDSVVFHDGRWRLLDEDSVLGSYDALVASAPAEQTAALLADVDTPVLDAVRSVEMEPTWSVMLAFDAPIATEFDAAFVHDSPLSWIARNNAKPGRSSEECWLLHSTHDWAFEHIDDDAEDVAAELTRVFLGEIGFAHGQAPILHRSAHRWRYAEATPPLEAGALYDPECRLAVAGDWVASSRVEGAFLSGCAAAGELLGTLGRPNGRPPPRSTEPQ